MLDDLFLEVYNKVNDCCLFRYSNQNRSSSNWQLNNTELSRNYPHAENENWKCLMIEYIYDGVDYPAFFWILKIISMI